MNDTRHRILVCARDLYLRHGIDGFSMRRIAKLAGISATAIYRHYENKQQLLLSVVVEGFKLFDRYLQRSLKEETPLDRLAASGRAYMDFALEHPQDYSLIFMAPQPWPASALPEPVARYSRATFQHLIAHVEACQADGALVKDDAEAVALTIWAHSHGLISLYLSGHFAEDERTFRQRWDTSVGNIFQGLASKGP